MKRHSAWTFYQLVCKCDNGEQELVSHLLRLKRQVYAAFCRKWTQAMLWSKPMKPLRSRIWFRMLERKGPYLHLYPHSQSGFCRRAWVRSCSTCTASPGRSAAGGWRPDLRPAPPCTSTLLMWSKCDRVGGKRWEVTHEWTNMNDRRWTFS